MAPINATDINEAKGFVPAKTALPEVETENGNGKSKTNGKPATHKQHPITSMTHVPAIALLNHMIGKRATRHTTPPQERAFDGEHECSRYSYEMLVDTANFLLSKIPTKPSVGIICGSGLGSYWNEGSLADHITDPINIPYEDIPNFPVSTVEGHHGRLVFGKLEGVTVVAMQGRFHYYEGYPLWKCCLPVRVMKLIGVKTLIATNAAGGLNPNYRIGDLMIVKDHINMMGFAGNNPLHGPNDERFGPRFPPMSKAYRFEFRKFAKEVAKELNIENITREGVYTCLGGPNFETVAELNMLKMVGVDAVGMSTVHEVITARHCDMSVFGLSLITNECVTSYDEESQANHEEVLDVGRMRQDILRKYVSRLVKKFAEFDNRSP